MAYSPYSPFQYFCSPMTLSTTIKHFQNGPSFQGEYRKNTSELLKLIALPYKSTICLISASLTWKTSFQCLWEKNYLPCVT